MTAPTPGAPDLPDTEARGPYGVSPETVAGLVPEVRIVVPGGNTNTGRVPITNDRITEWINLVSARVSSRLYKAPQITDPEKMNVIRLLAGAVVADGAGSYLEGAAHPERRSKADTNYAEVLWRRYQSGLDELAATIDGWIDDGTAEGGITSGGAAWSFPCPTVPDRNPWWPTW